MALATPTAPAIVTQPLGPTVRIGEAAHFTVAATGFPNSYQWCKDGVLVAGAVNASYGFMLTQTNPAGSYTVVVSNSLGSATSALAVLVVTPAIPAIPAIPGTVVAWGTNWAGQTTVPVAAQSGVTAIAAGQPVMKKVARSLVRGICVVTLLLLTPEKLRAERAPLKSAPRRAFGFGCQWMNPEREDG